MSGVEISGSIERTITERTLSLSLMKTAKRLTPSPEKGIPLETLAPEKGIPLETLESCIAAGTPYKHHKFQFF